MKLKVTRRNKRTWTFEFDPLTQHFMYRTKSDVYYADFISGEIKSVSDKKQYKVRDIVRPQSFELVN